MELKTLVQKVDELSVEGVCGFVSSVCGVRLVIFYCCVVDDEVLGRFVESLRSRLNVPFVGVRVSACLTNEDFHENSVVVGVLSGDFEVKVGSFGFESEDVEGGVNKVSGFLPDDGLCMVYSASYYPNGVYLDSVLRSLNSLKPNLQFTGIVSSAEPFIFSNKGVVREGLVCAVIFGAKYDFNLDSGFELKDEKEFRVTKSSEFRVNEVDNTNVVSLYCGLKHVRPYFINTVVNSTLRPDIHKVMRLLSKTNEKMYEAILKATVDFMGSTTAKDLVEPAFILHLDEEKSEWTTQSYKPKGTILKWLRIDADKLIQTYAKIAKKHAKSKAILGHECAYRIFYMNFRTKEIETEAKKIKTPLIIAYGYGEIGAYTPYTDKNTNVMHGGILQTIGFK